MISRRRFQSLLPAAVLAIPGCDRVPGTGKTPDAQPAANEVTHLVFLTAGATPHFEAAQQQSLAFMVGRSRNVTLLSFDAQNQAARQSAQWQEALAAKPAAIIVRAVDPESLAPAIRQAVGAGLFVIGLGNAMDDTGCSTVLWCDQAEIGRLAGETALRALTIRAREEGTAGPRGRLVQIRGDEDSAEGAERSAGFTSVINASPGLVLVHDAPGGWTREGGSQRMQDALRLQQNVDVVFAHNDAMALGAAQAAGSLRDSMLIIGVDGFGGPNGGITLVGNGDIDAVIYQPLLVDFAWNLVRKKWAEPGFQPKRSYQLAPQAITPKDVDAIRRDGLANFPEW